MSRRGIRAAACLVAGLFLAEARDGRAERARNVPRWIDAARVWRPDAETLLLWRFEETGAADSSPRKNHGEVRGTAQVDPDGHHGKCLRLSGGADGVFAKRPAGITEEMEQAGAYPLSADFWCRYDSAPRSAQSLFHMASSADSVAVLLELLPDGRLRISSLGLPAMTSAQPIPAGQWHHIAVVQKVIYQANNIYVEDTGLEVLVNGRPWVASLSGGSYAFPPAQSTAMFALGNNLKFDSGFQGRMDEFHLSNANRQYYELIRQDFADPENKKPIRRLKQHYRDPDSVVLHASFNRPEDLSAVQPPADPKLEPEDEAPDAPAQSQGPVEGDAGGTSAAATKDLEAGKDLQDDGGQEKTPDLDAQMAKDQEERFEPVEWVPGIKGGAVRVRGGPGTLRLPETADFTDGTIEFWFKPGDWDSLAPPLPKNSTFTYRNPNLNLVTLYGEPRDGQGEPQMLACAYASRVRSASYEFQFQPHTWTHVILAWGKNRKNYQPRYWFDTRHLYYDARIRLAKKADDAVWRKYRPAFIQIGSIKETVFDEIRVYPYFFVDPEVLNAYAEYTGQPMVDVGAAVCTFEYRMSIGKMLVTADVMIRNTDAAARADLMFRLPSENRVVKGTIDRFDMGQGLVELDVGSLPEGDYPCEGTLYDKQGNGLGEFRAVFRRKALPWLGNRLGILDTPPPPFEPVTVKERTVTTVGRAYTVGHDGNFHSVVVKGDEILSEPIRFRLLAGGKEVSLDPDGNVEFGERSAVTASWAGRVTGQGLLKIALSARLEYDGMTKYEIHLEPVGNEAAIDEFSLLIPLKESFGEYLHALPVSGDFRGYRMTTLLSSGEGVVWDSKTFSSKPAVMKMVAGNMVPMVWLGGVLNGLCWFADNDRGWVPSENKPAIAVSRKNGVIALGLHFISEPWILKAPRRIVYGLLATPPKPPPKDYRLWNRGNNETVGVIGGRLTSCDAFAPWEVPVKGEHCMAYWPKDYDWDFAKKASDRQRSSKHPKYANGKALMLYHDKRYVPQSREGEYFNWEWYRDKEGSFPPSKVDCLVWYMNEWFGRNIMDGIYIDDVFPVPDYNHETGSAYLLPDGRVQPGSSMFGYREYLKRMYALFYVHRKPPIITTHMTHTLAIPFQAFATVMFDGEDMGALGDAAATFIDNWPLDVLMTLENPERTGLVPVLMLKHQYVTRGRDEQAWAHMIYRTYRSAVADWLLFDMNVGFGHGMTESMRRTCESYTQPDTTVHPFWRNEAILSAKPLMKVPLTDPQLLPRRWPWREPMLKKIAADPLRATLFLKRGRALLVVVNFVRAPMGARIAVDWGRLGLLKAQRDALAIQDVDDWSEPTGVDLQRTGKPEVTDQDAGGPGTDTGEQAGLGVEDLHLEEKPDPKRILVKDGTITLTIRGHDFRLIEVQWGE